MLHRIYLAMVRARVGIAIAALAQVSGLLAGLGMVHAGNSFALGQRDGLVNRAQGSAILVSFGRGAKAKAALLDAAGNLMASVGGTVAGPGVVIPAGIAFYHGWVGGIVSVDGAHRSRLASAASASYYLIAVLLQSAPYILAVGAGISVGLAMVGPYFGWNLPYSGPMIRPYSLRLPRQALIDVLWIYAAVLPLLVVASLFEFFA